MLCDRLADTRHFRMLLSYVKWPDADPVRKELATLAPKLLMCSFEPEKAAAAARQAVAAQAAQVAAHTAAVAAAPAGAEDWAEEQYAPRSREKGPMSLSSDVGAGRR